LCPPQSPASRPHPPSSPTRRSPDLENRVGELLLLPAGFAIGIGVMFELDAGFAIDLRGPEREPVADVDDAGGPRLVRVRVPGAALEPFDDFADEFEALLQGRFAFTDEIARGGPHVAAEGADLLVARGFGDESDPAARVVIDRAERLVDPLYAELDLLGLAEEPLVE